MLGPCQPEPELILTKIEGLTLSTQSLAFNLNKPTFLSPDYIYSFSFQPRLKL